MAVGPSQYLVHAWLNALCNNTSFAVTQVYVQLHNGDPGAAGTANVASVNTRQAVPFGSPSAGIIQNDAIVEWASVGATEDPTFFTMWDASSGGNFLGSGTVDTPGYTTGEDFQAPIGSFSIDMSGQIAS